MPNCWKQFESNVDMLDVTCQMVGNDPKHISIVGNHAKQINKVGIDLKLGYNPKLMQDYKVQDITWEPVPR